MNIADLIAFEADIAAEFNAGKIRAPVHLAGGNEAELIRIFEGIAKDDWLALTWRSHYACLLKGVPPARLKADIMAGRSITMAYPDYRIVSSAIVGGALPIAVGIAMGIKAAGLLQKVHAFIGDMAALTGIYHECVQYSFRNALPIRFVVEDNGISVCTPTDAAWGEQFQMDAAKVETYSYELPWPHSGAGKRVMF